MKHKMHEASSALWKEGFKNQSGLMQTNREKELLRKPHHDNQLSYWGLDPKDLRIKAEVKVSRLINQFGDQVPTHTGLGEPLFSFLRCGYVLWQYWNAVCCWRSQQGPESVLCWWYASSWSSQVRRAQDFTLNV